tara:strand:- start:239 stop:388 length:150 start_codon:yes stop_codon:yes gene_type:complete
MLLTEQQKNSLQKLTEELEGKIKFVSCTNSARQSWNKIEIIYNSSTEDN